MNFTKNKVRYCYLIIFLAVYVIFSPGILLALTPHGDFSENTSFCEGCHQLLVSYNEGVNKFCFYCHDGSMPGKNTYEQFYIFPALYSSTATIKEFESSTYGYTVIYQDETTETSITSYGHWKNNEPIICISCHSPHVNLSKFPKLLFNEKEKIKASTDFCFACHRQVTTYTTATITGTTSTSTLIVTSARTFIDDGYYDSAHNLHLKKTTEVIINCLYCHLSHSSEKQNLLKSVSKDGLSGEENICFTCHEEAKDEFSYSSHHPVASQESKVECESCHNPHLVRESPTFSVSDPWNTRIITTAGVNFCIKCHGRKVPEEVKTSVTYVPYSIIFNDIPGPFFPGWNKEEFKNSSHFSKGYECSTCHDSHGSRNLNLIAFKGDNSFKYGEERLCFACHSEEGDAYDVESDFNFTYKHPVTLSYIHRNDENFSDLAFLPENSKRHAECVDCHNPHLATSISLNSNDLPGPLSGVGGVDSDLRAIKSIGNEYQLCYKCHSSFTIQPPGQGDKRSELDLQNPSYHPVEGRGKNRGIADESFEEPMSSSSVISCLDCHGNSKGNVHGSRYPFILKKSYQLEEANNKNEICFLCHKYEVYAEAFSVYTRFREHYLHSQEFSCYICHLSHGSSKKFLIADTFEMSGETYNLQFSVETTMGSCGIIPDDACHSSREYERGYE